MRRDSPRLMGERLPLCRRASGRCIVRFSKVPAHSRAPVVAARRGSGRLIPGFPVWASADSPEFSEVTPPLRCAYSYAARRLPSGQAQCVPAEDGHNSPRRQSRRLPPPAAGGQERTPEVDILTYQYRHAILLVWTQHLTEYTCQHTHTHIFPFRHGQ